MSELNLETTFQSIGTNVQQMEDKLRATLESGDPNKPGDLMKMQHEMQQWTMVTNMQSNIVKAMGEAMKSTIQNIR